MSTIVKLADISLTKLNNAEFAVVPVCHGEGRVQPPDCRETGGGAGGLCRDEALSGRAVAAPTPAGADGGRAGARPRKGGDGGSSHDVGAGFGGGDAEVAQRRVREPYRQPCRLAAGESGGVGETFGEQADCRHEYGVQPADGAAEEGRGGDGISRLAVLS